MSYSRGRPVTNIDHGSFYVPPSSYDYLLANLLPAAWWRLSDPVGSLTVTDSSGNGYAGTVNGDVIFGEPGPVANGTAALFDGSTGYVETSTSVPMDLLTGSVSFVAWVKLAASPTTQGLICGIFPNVALSIQSDDYAMMWLGSYANTVGPVSLGVWYQIVAVYQGNGSSTRSLYLDGSFVDEDTSGSAADESGLVSVGAQASWRSYSTYFPGDVAEVAIFTRALTAAEIAALWQAAQ